MDQVASSLADPNISNEVQNNLVAQLSSIRQAPDSAFLLLPQLMPPAAPSAVPPPPPLASVAPPHLHSAMLLSQSARLSRGQPWQAP